jgi:hypothetical protein
MSFMVDIFFQQVPDFLEGPVPRLNVGSIFVLEHLDGTLIQMYYYKDQWLISSQCIYQPTFPKRPLPWDLSNNDIDTIPLFFFLLL